MNNNIFYGGFSHTRFYKISSLGAGKCQFKLSISPRHLHSISSVPTTAETHFQVKIKRFLPEDVERYLCVIHESSSSVTWPDLNISHPAWAIIAPLSMQNLSQIDTGIIGWRCSDPVLVTWLPLVCGKQLSSSFLTHHPHHLLQTKVTWRAEETLLGRGGGDREVHLSWDVTYIQHPRQSGPPGSRSEPWPSRWSPPAWQTRSPVLKWRKGHVKNNRVDQSPQQRTMSKMAVCSAHLQGETQVLCRTLTRTQHLVRHILREKEGTGCCRAVL